MTIKDIMTKDVISVQYDTKIIDVAKILHKHNIHGVPVLDGTKLVGIITETDFFTNNDCEIYLPSYIEFLKKVKSMENVESEEKFKAILSAKAEDIMTKECVTLLAQNDVSVMFKLIKEAGLHSVPVVNEENNLVGIVTVADVIKLI